MKRNLLLIGAAIVLCSGIAMGQTISTFAGNGVMGFSGDSSMATAAEFNHPWGVARDHAGNVYISDYVNSCVRKINAAGIISIYAGTTVNGHSGDGGPATDGMMMRPSGMTVDQNGNLYIADAADNRIRKVDNTGVITTLAGTGVAAYSGDGGPDTSAAFNSPTSIALDATGAIYIADSGNNTIRKIDLSGNVTSYAGNGTPGHTGDGGPADSATLTLPTGVAIDASGNIFIADRGNNVVRKINTSGTISTFAGTGVAGYGGDGGAATAAMFTNPNSVAFDNQGNVYISDEGNNRIRKVNAAGVITTIAGNGMDGYSGDGGPADSASLFRPAGIAVDSAGDIYIGDFVNSVVRFVNVATAAVTAIPAISTALLVYPDPATDLLSVELNSAMGATTLHVINALGQCVYSGDMLTRNKQLDISGLSSGTYYISCSADGNVVASSRFIKN